MKNNKNTQTFSSFKDMAKAMHRRDIEAAERLRRSAPLRKGKNTLAVAKPVK